MKEKDQNEVARSLNAAIAKLPTETQSFKVPVSGAKFMGSGRFLSIAYLLDSEELC
ncbi:MAG TPA: hypothetical protein VJ836_03875 [Candidatus Saccharimonadales bacterium]|nr:hypothetical protein [Candidatus Saccharimonadales bacterium]